MRSEILLAALVLACADPQAPVLQVPDLQVPDLPAPIPVPLRPDTPAPDTLVPPVPDTLVPEPPDTTNTRTIYDYSWSVAFRDGQNHTIVAGAFLDHDSPCEGAYEDVPLPEVTIVTTSDTTYHIKGRSVDDAPITVFDGSLCTGVFNSTGTGSYSVEAEVATVHDSSYFITSDFRGQGTTDKQQIVWQIVNGVVTVSYK